MHTALIAGTIKLKKNILKMDSNHSILFVHSGKGLGGAPKALRYLIEVCVQVGHSCAVACLDCPQTVPYFQEAGAEIIIVESLP